MDITTQEEVKYTKALSSIMGTVMGTILTVSVGLSGFHYFAHGAEVSDIEESTQSFEQLSSFWGIDSDLALSGIFFVAGLGAFGAKRAMDNNLEVAQKSYNLDIS